MNNMMPSVLFYSRMGFFLLILLFSFGCQTVGTDLLPGTSENIAIENSSTSERTTTYSVTSEPATIKVDPRDAQHQYALYLARDNQVERAIDAFKTLSQSTPAFKNSLTNLGLLYIESKQFDLAESTLVKATQQNTEDATAWNHLGFLYRQKGDFKAAKNAYEKSITLDQKYASALLNFAILNDIYLQNLPLALNLYQRYLQIESGDDKVKKWVVDLERRI